MYSIDVFESIINANNVVKLSEKVIENIEILHKLMNIHARTEPAPRKSNRDNVDSWKKKEKFKPTEVSKLEGIDQIVGDVKKFLNKLTTKNYELYSPQIVELVSKLIDNNADDTDINQVINTMVSVSCNNKYYSNLYAKLYMILIDRHQLFHIEKEHIISDYLDGVNNIISANPNEDYDKFCEINKKNEQRGSRLVFIINLFKENGYNTSELLNIINILIDNVNNKKNDINNVEIVNGIVDDINIFITNMVSQCKTDTEFINILDIIREYSKCNIKECHGISTRAKFKFMDMIDLFK